MKIVITFMVVVGIVLFTIFLVLFSIAKLRLPPSMMPDIEDVETKNNE